MGMLTVYLDQNKWIDLAKALYRSDARPQDEENARALGSAVLEGRVRFPVSETHIMEASRIRDREQRLQLATIMAGFSDGWFLAGRQARLEHEIDAALRRLLSVEGMTESFSPCQRDFFWAFGGAEFLSSVVGMSAERLTRITSAIQSSNLLLSFLAFDDDDNRRQAVEHMTSSNDELIARIRERRNRLLSESADLRKRAYSAVLFYDSQDKIAAGLGRIGRSFDDLRTLPDEQIASLVDLVPCWHVERCLAVAVEQQKSRELDGNDVYDIAALTAAVPYADVVVTEKLWVHLANVSGLAVHYNTSMISSVHDVVNFLQPAEA